MSDEPEAKKPRLAKAAEAVLAGDVNSLKAILEDQNFKEWLVEPLDDVQVTKGWNILHLAVANDQVPCIEILLEKVPKLATLLSSSHPLHTPLTLAVKEQKELETIKALLKGEDKNGLTEILWQAFQANRPGSYPLDVVKLLLENGATHPIISNCFLGPISGKNLEVVKLLIERGCNPGACFINDDDKEFPLYKAAEKGSLDIVNLLIKLAPSTVKAKTQNKSTALLAAARHGHADCVEALIAAGANVTDQDEFCLCALSNAAAYGHASVIRVLLKQKAIKAMAVKMRNWRHELHPITNAVTSGSEETVRLLVQSKFLRYDLTSDNEEEVSIYLIDTFCVEWEELDCISYALNVNKGDTVGIVNALLDAGYPVNGSTRTKPLTVAVMQMQFDEENMEKVVRRMLEGGANFKYTKKKGDYLPPEALVVAIQIESEKALRLLLQFWDRPPYELLAIYDDYPDVSPLKLDLWFPLLFQYGLPHGHPMVSILETKLELRMEDEKISLRRKKTSGKHTTVNKEKLLASFLEQMKVPSSLKKLTRFAVRSYFGKHALQAKVTLPTLLNGFKDVSLPSDIMPFILLEEP